MKIRQIENRKSGSIGQRRNGSRGFTMVELIVVLVILAILAAILIPSYIGYVEKENAKVCAINRENVVNYYEIYSRIYTEEYASFEAYVQDKYGSLDKMCPAGGVYTCTVLSNGSITVSCSAEGHGSNEQSSTDVMSGLASILTTDPTIVKYFGESASREINSEAQRAGSYAEKVNAALREMGIDPDKFSWKIEKVNGTFYIYWTGIKIKNREVGTTVSVLRGQVLDGQIANTVSGLCTIESTKSGGAGQAYNILTNFVSD